MQEGTGEQSQLGFNAWISLEGHVHVGFELHSSQDGRDK